MLSGKEFASAQTGFGVNEIFIRFGESVKLLFSFTVKCNSSICLYTKLHMIKYIYTN